MPRQARLDAPGTLHHVMVRGSEGKPIFAEGELRGGGQRRQVSDLRKEIAYYLSREGGVSMAEIGRQVGVSASAVAKAIQKKESEKK